MKCSFFGKARKNYKIQIYFSFNLSSLLQSIYIQTYKFLQRNIPASMSITTRRWWGKAAERNGPQCLRLWTGKISAGYSRCDPLALIIYCQRTALSSAFACKTKAKQFIKSCIRYLVQYYSNHWLHYELLRSLTTQIKLFLSSRTLKTEFLRTYTKAHKSDTTWYEILFVIK